MVGDLELELRSHPNLSHRNILGKIGLKPGLFSHQVVGSMPTAGSAGSVPEKLNLFPEPDSKAEETGKKQLSKDSILSLYGSHSPQIPAQGMRPHLSWETHLLGF